MMWLLMSSVAVTYNQHFHWVTAWSVWPTNRYLYPTNTFFWTRIPRTLLLFLCTFSLILSLSVPFPTDLSLPKLVAGGHPAAPLRKWYNNSTEWNQDVEELCGVIVVQRDSLELTGAEGHLWWDSGIFVIYFDSTGLSVMLLGKAVKQVGSHNIQLYAVIYRGQSIDTDMGHNLFW